MSTEKKLSITVVAKQPSRWRAGMQFTSAPKAVEVTEAQHEAIKADPLLAIVADADESEGDADDRKRKRGKADA